MMPQITCNTQTLRVLLLASFTLLAGCESTPTALERNFGSSVRNMLELQSAHPRHKGFGMDGRKSERVLEAYREDVAEPQKVEENLIQIQLGQ
jgi:hypothetical protein